MCKHEVVADNIFNLTADISHRFYFLLENEDDGTEELSLFGRSRAALFELKV